MSTSKHNAPIHTLNNSKSNRSLYTENSQDSEIGIRKQQQNLSSPRKEELISEKIAKLPSIGVGNIAEKGRRDTIEKADKRESYDGMPSLPQAIGSRYNRDEHNDNRHKSFQLGHLGPQFNTIAVTSLDRSSLRNPYGQMQNPMQMTGMSGISPVNESQRSRMLRSSQGGRWFRSQSLMQDKSRQQKTVGNLNSIEMITKNFHRHESKYVDQLQSYIKYYSGIQKQLQEKSDIFYKYKLNVGDSLEQIKNKMQNYLESKIDLSNLPIDRPDSDWGQEQLMKFYTNYHQILNEKIQFPLTEQEKEGGNNTKIIMVLKKYKNCTYYGPVKDGKKHGFGYLHYFSGRFYEGLFENDQKVKGFEMDDAELYLGEYQRNQRHGQGILKTNEFLLSGIFHCGQFKIEPSNSKLNLTGFTKQGQRNQPTSQLSTSILRKGFKIEFSSVVFYMGNSTVIEKNNNGDIFIGQINQEGQKNGEGLQIFYNGDLYIGKYQQGAPEGYGEYYWQSGAFYRGDFLSGMRHGKGVWMMVHGDRYEGDYLNDKKNGKGIYLWKSGDRYQGQFQNDYRHGYGQMYWRDGTSFKGHWLNGIQVNKTFKIGNEQKQQKIAESHATKNTFKTVQTRTRILKKQQFKNVSRNSKNSRTIQQTSSQPAKNPYLHNNNNNNKRVPLQKLKAMLNPSNSIN